MSKKKFLKAVRYWLKAKNSKISILGSMMLEGLRQKGEDLKDFKR